MAHNPTTTYQQYKRACQLATDDGFFKAYFDMLPSSRTNIEAFLAVNEEAFEHFGEYRYDTHNAFRLHLRRWHKKHVEHLKSKK